MNAGTCVTTASVPGNVRQAYDERMGVLDTSGR
jgi:hypothetical protein